MIALDWDIIKTNIQSKFEEEWAKNVLPKVVWKFYVDIS